MKPGVIGPIRKVYGESAHAMRENASVNRTITSENVFQQANSGNRELIHRMMDQLVIPGSGIVGMEHLADMSERSRQGASCLILMEHYSNFDIPCLYYLLEKGDRKDIADQVVAIAGMKLNEESPFVNAFAEAYTRVVIYPSRSLEKITDPDVYQKERQRSTRINMSATRQIVRLKHAAHIVLLFPSGTRYRDGQPDTKRGVKEVDSYLKLFDYAVFIGIAGNVLRIDPDGDMSNDIAAYDLVVLDVSEPINCNEFRDAARAKTPEGTDPKQYVADRVMDRLEEVHERSVAERDRLLAGD